MLHIRDRYTDEECALLKIHMQIVTSQSQEPPASEPSQKRKQAKTKRRTKVDWSNRQRMSGGREIGSAHRERPSNEY